MYGKVKLSKRQIKEDKFTTFMFNAKHQFTENWQFYVIGIIILALVIVAITYFVDSQKAKSVEATDTYSQAVLQYRSGNTQIAVVTLNQVIDDYSGEEAAEKATFLLGNINLGTNNYPEAIRYFGMYTDKYKNKNDFLTLSSSYAGIAVAYENQGQYTEAAQFYQKAIDAYPDGPQIGDYLFGAMRNYVMAGDVEQAKPYKERIEKDFKNTDLELRAVRFYTEQTTQQ